MSVLTESAPYPAVLSRIAEKALRAGHQGQILRRRLSRWVAGAWTPNSLSHSNRSALRRVADQHEPFFKALNAVVGLRGVQAPFSIFLSSAVAGTLAFKRDKDAQQVKRGARIEHSSAYGSFAWTLKSPSRSMY